jgi:hypothetical protein
VHQRLAKSSGMRPFKTFFLKGLLPLITLIGTFTLEGQELRRTAFSFLNIPASARMAGLGGVNVSLTDRDPNGFFFNPAITGDTLAGFASAGYQFYVADIGHASFSYLPYLPKIGMIAIGVQHLNYGTMPAYDASGNEIGDWKAAETAIVLSKQHQIRHFRMGASLKMIASSMAGFRATAAAIDLGGVFIHPGNDLTIGIAVKNIGLIFSDFTPGSDSALPLDVQVGTTFKPEHMPIRFSLTIHRLVQSRAITFTNSRPAEPATLEKVFRHFNLGTELLIHRNVNILVGYNYGIRQELKVENAAGGSGLSFGFSAHVKTVDFTFSRSTYVAGSGSYTFTVFADIDRMLRKN